MDILLWIDDERQAPTAFTHWAKTSREAIYILASMNQEDVLVAVSFDHDLSMDPTDGHPKADDGEPYDDSRAVVKWMHKTGIYPQTAYIHSMNSVGSRWLYEELVRFCPTYRMPYNKKNYS